MATNLVEAAPIEQVRPVSESTRARMLRAITSGLPRRRRAPATSRNASSMLSGCTSGVTSRKMPMTRREYSRVLRAVRRQDHRLRAQLHRPCHRHRRPDAVCARLVGGGGDDTATGGASDDDGLAAQLGVVEQLDAGEEGVHVDVQDGGVVAVDGIARGLALALTALHTHASIFPRASDIAARSTSAGRAQRSASVSERGARCGCRRRRVAPKRSGRSLCEGARWPRRP